MKRRAFIQRAIGSAGAIALADSSVASALAADTPYYDFVIIGAGTANGVAMIDEGDRGSLSPFHFAQTRLALHEPPHMHASMAFVPVGNALPSVGDHVDVQRPLHMTTVDEYRWL